MQNGAIFYASRYGSTEQCAHWIADELDIPVYDLRRDSEAPSTYDFAVIAVPVIYHKLMGRKWIRQHTPDLLTRPTFLVSVSGAGAGKKLDGWIAASVPPELIAHAEHFALRGRQNPKELNTYDWVMLKIGGLMNPDRQASRDEMKGFDYMDKAQIAPLVERVRHLQNAHPDPASPS